jgi:hypothetical protein
MMVSASAGDRYFLLVGTCEFQPGRNSDRAQGLTPKALCDIAPSTSSGRGQGWRLARLPWVEKLSRVPYPKGGFAQKLQSESFPDARGG